MNVRLGSIVAILLLLGFAAAEAVGGTTDSPAVSLVLLVDGNVARAAGRIERRGTRLVFRNPEGVLVSVSEKQVASIEPATLESSSRPVRPVSRDESGDVSAITNDDLPASPLPTRVTGRSDRAEEETPDSEVFDVRPLTYDSYLDIDGHDEAWWRARTSRLEAEREVARKHVDRAHVRYNELDDIARLQCTPAQLDSPTTRMYCASVLSQRHEAQLDAETAGSRLEEIERELRTIRDEARAARALPAWLR